MKRLEAIGAGWRVLVDRSRDAARLMIGVPDYQAYRRHMAQHHPEREPMDYARFFRERQQAHYGSGRGGRCC